MADRDPRMGDPNGIRELSTSEHDLRILLEFYRGLYSTAFPDKNEREAYENIAMYLRGEAAPHSEFQVVLAFDGDEVVGGSIADYFLASNSAVIEFITVARDRRRAGLGSRLLRETEDRLHARARARGRELAFITAEINDPFRRTGIVESMDPFARARWWANRGYDRLDFPYIQPPLSAQQEAVRYLTLTAKSRESTLSSAALDAFIRDYLRYAMRIPRPDASPEYVGMARWLSRHPEVRIQSLNAYIGDDRQYPLDVRETSLKVVEELCESWPAGAVGTVCYTPRHDAMPPAHAWVARHTATGDLAGLAAFSTLPTGGVTTLFASNDRAMRPLLGRIERQILEDDERATGWLLECPGAVAKNVLSALGFFELDVNYDRSLALVYKDLGARYTPPEVSPEAFLASARALGVQLDALEAQARCWVRVPVVTR